VNIKMVKKIKCEDYKPYASSYDNACIKNGTCEVAKKYKNNQCDGEFVVPKFVKFQCPIGHFLSIDEIIINLETCDYTPWRSSHDDFRPRCTMKCMPRPVREVKTYKLR